MRFLSDEAALAYLSGLIDGEGNIKWGRSDRRIRIRMCDREPIEACEEIAKHFGLHYKIYWNSKNGDRDKRVHELEISGEYTLKWLVEHLPLQILSKKDKLVKMANSYVNHHGQKEDPRFERIVQELLCQPKT